MLNLFDSCIAPILLYGNEVWDPFMNFDWKRRDNTQIDKIHTQFLKRLLGVNISTTNVLIRTELGRHSLQEQILARNINYIKYIESKDPQALVKQSTNYEIRHIGKRNPLYSLLKKYLTHYGKHRSTRSQKLKFESYLTDVKNRKLRVIFTKYRLSDHCLMIEKGRHKRSSVPREECFCSFCPSTVENEIHFLTQCSAYKNRNELFNMI